MTDDTQPEGAEQSRREGRMTQTDAGTRALRERLDVARSALLAADLPQDVVDDARAAIKEAAALLAPVDAEPEASPPGASYSPPRVSEVPQWSTVEREGALDRIRELNRRPRAAEPDGKPRWLSGELVGTLEAIVDHVTHGRHGDAKRVAEFLLARAIAIAAAPGRTAAQPDARSFAAQLRSAFEAGFWAGRGDYRNVLEAWHAHLGIDPPTLAQYRAHYAAHAEPQGGTP